RALAERARRGVWRPLWVAECPRGGKPGAAVADATDVTGGGAPAKSTGGGVPRWDGQRGAAGAKRRTRRAGGARPAPPGVDSLGRLLVHSFGQLRVKYAPRSHS